MSEPLWIIIDGVKYDITDYYTQHPGLNLDDFEGQDVTTEWNYYHPPNKQGKAHYILNRVKSRGNFSGIRILSKL
jgi:cytochrome b involved in lipid metabolism